MSATLVPKKEFSNIRKTADGKTVELCLNLEKSDTGVSEWSVMVACKNPRAITKTVTI